MSFSRKEYFTRPYSVAEGSMASRDNTDNIRFVVWTALSTVVLAVVIGFMPILSNHGLIATHDYNYFQMIGLFWKYGPLIGILALCATTVAPVFGVMEAEYTWRCVSISDEKFQGQMRRLRFVRYLSLCSAFMAITLVIGLAQGESISPDPGALLMLVCVLALCALPLYVFVVGKEVLRSQVQPVPVEAD